MVPSLVPRQEPAVPDPAAPAPPPAARVGAAEFDASLRRAARRVEDGESGAIDRPSRALERRGRYENAAAEPSPFDEEEDSAARLDAGLDERVRRAGEDKAQGAAARGRAGRRRAPDPRAGATPEAPAPSTSGSPPPRRSRRRPAPACSRFRSSLFPRSPRRGLRQPRERGCLGVRAASGLSQAIERQGDAMQPWQWEPRR